MLTILLQARPSTPPQGFSPDTFPLNSDSLGAGPEKREVETDFAPRRDTGTTPHLAPPHPAPPPPGSRWQLRAGRALLYFLRNRSSRRAHPACAPSRPVPLGKDGHGGRSRPTPGRMAPLSSGFRQRCAGPGRSDGRCRRRRPGGGRTRPPGGGSDRAGPATEHAQRLRGAALSALPVFPRRRLELEAGWESSERPEGGGRGLGAIGLQTSPTLRAAPWGGCCKRERTSRLLRWVFTQTKPPGGPRGPDASQSTRKSPSDPGKGLLVTFTSKHTSRLGAQVTQWSSPSFPLHLPPCRFLSLHRALVSNSKFRQWVEPVAFAHVSFPFPATLRMTSARCMYCYGGWGEWRRGSGTE